VELPLPRVLFSVVLFFGLVFAVLYPPMQTPDETSHLWRAVRVSEGDLWPRANGDDCTAIPDSLMDLTTRYERLKGQLANKQSYKPWQQDTYRNDASDPQTPRCFSAQTVSPLLYIPPSLGILTGRLLFRASTLKEQKFNWTDADYFARFGNLMAMALAAATACAWARRFGAVIFAVCTLPMVMQSAASPSYDVTTFCSCLLFFALVVKVASRETPPMRWETVVLVVLAFFVAHAKIVYVPVIAVAWALKRWMSPRSFLYLCLGLGVAVVCGVLLGLNSETATAGERALQHQQLAEIVSHPGRILMRLNYTFDKERDFWLISFLGDLGWLDTLAPLPMLMTVWGLLFCAVVGDALRGPSPLGWVASGLLLIGAAASFLGVILVLYVIWTSKVEGVGSVLMTGVQGRYFLPLAISVMAAVAAGPRALAARAQAARINLLQFQIVCGVGLLAGLALVLLARYWIPDFAA
jgi:uncharacterized membrane protein